MGEVYLAEDAILPRAVALKILPEADQHNAAMEQRFMREARAASALSHPNIARIYEAGRDGERVFIAMEYVEGETLDRRIARGGLSIDEIIAIAIQLAGALTEAHARAVVHRDIKPSNIMITPRGEVKVLDFGLAKIVDTDLFPAMDSTAFKTTPGTVMGTIPYMSPEQALAKEADHRSDIFSFGIVLYEMVTQRMPFVGGNAAETMLRIVSAQPEPMARYNYDLPLELERIIRKCLEKDPQRRYQSVSEALIDLRNLERDRQLSSDPRVAEARMGALPVAKRAAMWGLVAAVATIVALALWKRPFINAPHPVQSIAVLPFENRVGRNAGYLSDGVSEALLDSLAQLPGIRVMARSTSFQYRNDSPMQAGRALHVDAVLTGTLATEGLRVVATTELVDVRDGSRISGSRVERDSHDVATIGTAIVNDIAHSLNIAAPVPRANASREAYDLYLRGRHEWNQRTAESLQSAIERFRETIEIDPRFAPAYAGLADSYVLLERYGSAPNEQNRNRAIAAAEHAVELDRSLPEAHASLGSVCDTYLWDWPAAEQEYNTAIRLSPSYATAHHWYAMLLARLGRFDEALQEIRLARDLDPLSGAIGAAEANIQYYRHNFPESINAARRTARIAPKFAINRVQLALSLAMNGDPAAAELELQPLLSNNPFAAAADAVIRGRAGDVKAARGFLHIAESRPDAAANGYGIAAVHAAIGERSEAVTWLDRAYVTRPVMLTYVGVDPAFDSLRGDPDFEKLLNKLRLPSMHG